jgi:hypothetical protein
LAFYEIKSNGAEVTDGCQKNTMSFLNEVVKKACKYDMLKENADKLSHLGVFADPEEGIEDSFSMPCTVSLTIDGIHRSYTYMGFHTLEFENDEFTDGWCKYDGVKISQENLIRKMSFEDQEALCYSCKGDIDPCSTHIDIPH